MSASPPHVATSWPAVALMVGAGVVAAAQVGKAPIALPAIRAEFDAGLDSVAWVLSALQLMGASVGAFMGAVVIRMGARPMLVAALLLQAAASTVGAMAPGLGILIAARAVEGLGLVVAVIGAPALMTEFTHPKDRSLAFGIWGSFMPVGMALAMAGAPALALIGWRGLWLAMGALAATFAFLVLWRLPAGAKAPAAALPPHLGRDLMATLRAPGPLRLGLIFTTYTVAWGTMTGFLPTLLIERLGVGTGVAGVMTALATFCNIIGNLLAAALLKRGVPRWKLLAGACTLVGLSGVGIFSGLAPPWVAYGLCLTLSATGGLLPGTVFGGAAEYSVPRLVPVALGLMTQGSNIGMVLGPVAVGLAVATLGWEGTCLVLAPAAAAGVALAVSLRRIGH